ncbi:MAG: ParB/RepB/Spo0J family partition protein [Acidimicrobiia bacterium]
MLAIGSLVPAADNVRRRVGDVRELAASVASVGIVEPLLVSPLDAERHVIVAGHRRHAAAVRAGLAEVPCTVRELSEGERVEIMLIENLQQPGGHAARPGSLAPDRGRASDLTPQRRAAPAGRDTEGRPGELSCAPLAQTGGWLRNGVEGHTVRNNQ